MMDVPTTTFSSPRFRAIFESLSFDEKHALITAMLDPGVGSRKIAEVLTRNGLTVGKTVVNEATLELQWFGHGLKSKEEDE